MELWKLVPPEEGQRFLSSAGMAWKGGLHGPNKAVFATGAVWLISARKQVYKKEKQKFLQVSRKKYLTATRLSCMIAKVMLWKAL